MTDIATDTRLTRLEGVDCPRCDAAESADPIATRTDAQGRAWICYLCSVCAKTHERHGAPR